MLHRVKKCKYTTFLSFSNLQTGGEIQKGGGGRFKTDRG